MASLRILGWVVVSVSLVLGCGGGGAGTTTGAGGETGTTSSSGAGAGGGGGAGGGTSTTTTTSTASSTSGGPMYQASGLSCSGAAPTLSKEVAPIIAANCSMGYGCHAAAATAAGFYDQFVMRLAEECLDGRLMVDPGKPEQSYVIHKATNHNLCGGETMPKGSPMLGTSDVQVIYDWICTGAPKN